MIELEQHTKTTRTNLEKIGKTPQSQAGMMQIFTEIVTRKDTRRGQVLQ